MQADHDPLENNYLLLVFYRQNEHLHLKNTYCCLDIQVVSLWNWKPVERMMSEKDMDRMSVVGMENSDFLYTLTVVAQDMMTVIVQDMMAVVVQDTMSVVVQDMMAVIVQDTMVVVVQNMVVAVNHIEVVQDMVDSHYHKVVIVVWDLEDMKDTLVDLVDMQDTAQNPSTQKKNILLLHAIKHKTNVI